MKAKSLNQAQIDKKRKNNTADSCYFYVPANKEGLGFIKGIRKHLNRARFDLRVRRRGLHADSYGGVKPENVTHFGIYLYNQNITANHWKQVRENQDYWYKRGIEEGKEQGRKEIMARILNATEVSNASPRCM